MPTAPLRRIPTVQALVDRKACFVLHAPRQSGKTTALLAMAKERRSEKTLQQGLEQLGAYLDRLGEPTGYLLLFDQRALSWDERLFQTDAVAPGGQAVRVFGM